MVTIKGVISPFSKHQWRTHCARLCSLEVMHSNELMSAFPSLLIFTEPALHMEWRFFLPWGPVGNCCSYLSFRKHLLFGEISPSWTNTVRVFDLSQWALALASFLIVRNEADLRRRHESKGPFQEVTSWVSGCWLLSLGVTPEMDLRLEINKPNIVILIDQKNLKICRCKIWKWIRSAGTKKGRQESAVVALITQPSVVFLCGDKWQLFGSVQ